MRDLKNKLTSSKNTKNIQNRRGKSFGYQVLGFGAGGVTFSATGGSEIQTVGTYKYHMFNATSTFSVTGSGDVDIMVIGAGGGGGSNGSTIANGGGAGAGAKEPSSGYTTQTLTAANYTVTIASKGLASTNGSVIGGTPSATSFAGTSTISALGGGGGGSSTSPSNSAGGAGGSGGGVYGNRSGAGGAASGSNTNIGGIAYLGGAPSYGAGGGGGATAAGTQSTANVGGSGGQGLTLTSMDSNLTAGNFSTFTGMTVVCSGGGGAVDEGATAGGTAGTGGGNGGINGTGLPATSFGSGGGGSGDDGHGFGGLVIVRYVA